MSSRLLVVFLALVAVTACNQGGPGKSKAELKTDEQKFSYAVGQQIGQSLKRDSTHVDVPALSQGISDALSGAKPQVPAEELQAAINAVREKKQAADKKAAEDNKKAGTEFLAANKKKKGVVTLPSGVQYKVLKAGTGKKPTLDDTVVANYRGTLINGKEFDSSYERGEPATFPVKAVIKGWQEVLPLMKEGAKWEVYIPAELAYGDKGAGGVIGPNDTLIFEIELVKVK